MPLIMLSGYPCSGKTYRAQQLQEYFHKQIESATDPQHKRLKVVHISDDTLGLSRSVYDSAREEKDARASLESAVKRELRKDVIIILDAMNYIKGFRYQLYCEAKAVQTPSCVVHVGTPIEKCTEINEQRLAASNTSEPTASEESASEPTPSDNVPPASQPTSEASTQSPPTTHSTSATPSTTPSPPPYPPTLLTNLIYRYEEPNGLTRWDSPLFTLPYSDPHPPYTPLWTTLIGAPGTTKLIRPNAATLLPSAQPVDALQQLDRTTSGIVNRILGVLREDPDAGEVRVEGVEERVRLPMGGVGVGGLQRLRRQFVGMQRGQSGARVEGEGVGRAFVGFLNGAWGTEGG